MNRLELLFLSNFVHQGLQSEENRGQYYTLDSSIKKQLFLHGGFTKLFESQCKTFRETCLMVRDPALELMHYLKTTNFNNPITRYCLCILSNCFILITLIANLEYRKIIIHLLHFKVT
jgi:hypothetical protein